MESPSQRAEKTDPSLLDNYARAVAARGLTGSSTTDQNRAVVLTQQLRDAELAFLRRYASPVAPDALPTDQRPRDDQSLYAFQIYVTEDVFDAVVSGARLAPTIRKGGLAPWQERRAKDLIDANLVKGVRVEEVAEACGLSVSYFTHAFRTSTGHPPHSWLLKRRLEFAMRLIREGRSNLADIAVATGFADQSHLTRVFKRRVGISPSLWRRSLPRDALHSAA